MCPVFTSNLRPAGLALTGFEYLGCRIGLGALPSQHDQWLLEFLAPAFVPLFGETSSFHFSVSLSIDAGRFDELQRQGERGASLDAFVLDSGVARLPQWSAEPDVVLAYDESTRVFYRRQETQIEVISRDDRAGLRIALMRAIRELATEHAKWHGAIVLHAAAFVLEGKAVIVAGDKGAGKTTLLLQALVTGGAKYLSNDRLLIEPEGQRVHGMPTIVSIRSGSLGVVQNLATALQVKPYHFRSTLHEVRSRFVPLPESDEARAISPAQLCQLADVASTGRVDAALMLFLQSDKRGLAPRLTPVSASQGPQFIRDALLGAPEHAGGRSRLFAVAGAGMAPAENMTLQRFAAHIPAFQLAPGTGESSAQANFDAIVGQLARSG